MPDYDFIPGYPKLGDDVGGSPYNPPGSEFATAWLNPILKTIAVHWTTLAVNTTATIADYGKSIKLNGKTLTLDPVADLHNGWQIIVRGPGIVQPDAGEGDPITLISTQWARVTHDDGVVEVLISSEGSQEPLSMAAELAGGVEEGTYPVARYYHTVSSFTHLYADIITGTGSVIFYLQVNDDDALGPYSVAAGVPLNVTVDIGLEIGDTVDLILEAPTGLVEFLYAQLDGSN